MDGFLDTRDKRDFAIATTDLETEVQVHICNPYIPPATDAYTTERHRLPRYNRVNRVNRSRGATADYNGSSSCNIVLNEEFTKLARDINDPVLLEVWNGMQHISIPGNLGEEVRGWLAVVLTSPRYQYHAT